MKNLINKIEELKVMNTAANNVEDVFTEAMMLIELYDLKNDTNYVESLYDDLYTTDALDQMLQEMIEDGRMNELPTIYNWNDNSYAVWHRTVQLSTGKDVWRSVSVNDLKTIIIESLKGGC